MELNEGNIISKSKEDIEFEHLRDKEDELVKSILKLLNGQSCAFSKRILRSAIESIDFSSIVTFS